MIFSMDVLIAFLLIIGMLYIMLLHFDLFENRVEAEISKFTLMKNAVMLSDSLVKNCEIGIGLAKSDFSSHRCLSNELSSLFLNDKNYFETDEFFVERIEVEFVNFEKKELFKSEKISNNECVSSERFVYLDGRKAKLNLVVCDE